MFILKLHNSSDSLVVLQSVNLSSSGRYRCEVSGEAPSFNTVDGYGDMVVVGRSIREFIRNFGILKSGPTTHPWFSNVINILNTKPFLIIFRAPCKRKIIMSKKKYLTPSKHFTGLGRLNLEILKIFFISLGFKWFFSQVRRDNVTKRASNNSFYQKSHKNYNISNEKWNIAKITRDTRQTISRARHLSAKMEKNYRNVSIREWREKTSNSR